MTYERTFAALDNKLTRKPANWDEVADIPSDLEDTLRPKFAELPVVEFSERSNWPLQHNPLLVMADKILGIVSVLIDGEAAENFYYIDTGGADYVRYALRLSQDPREESCACGATGEHVCSFDREFPEGQYKSLWEKKDLERAYGENAVALAEIMWNAVVEMNDGDSCIMQPIRGDGHGLNFIVETGECEQRRVIITEP